MWKHHKSSGQTLVELLVAIGLAAIMLPALITALVASREGGAQDNERLQATALLREADEAVRSVRENGWSQIATNGTYKPVNSGTTWTLSAGAETVGTFTRQIVIADAQRNSAGALVDSGGTIDPSTKKVTTSISWATPIPTTLSDQTYYTRYLGNNATLDTTQAQFNTGIFTNTESAIAEDGEVQLIDTPGAPNWASPSIAGSYDTAGTEDALDVFVSGNYAYVADTTVLRIVDITNPAAPTLAGSYTASGTINSVSVSGNYAFLALTTDTAELTVVNVTNKASPTLAGSLDLTSTTDATSIFISGTFAYIGRVNSTTAGVNEFVIANITTPTAPTLSGSLNLSSTVNSIFVSGNFAYAATSIGTAELTIVNVTTKTAPTQAGVYNTTGTAIANDVFAVGTTVYLAKANDTSGAEFFIINAANAASPALVGSYEAGANINGVYVSGTTAYLATAVTNAQFRALNITTPASPTVLSSFNLAAISNDITGSGDYIYIASAHDTRELTIMQGAATATSYPASGTYESASRDFGSSVGLNYLRFTLTEPASTNVQIQIATNNNNSTWNYVGPDGTAGTFYTVDAAIPLNNAAARYIRYKMTLTGPGTSTPVVKDVRIGYAP